jgi:hypothetical protein
MSVLLITQRIIARKGTQKRNCVTQFQVKQSLLQGIYGAHFRRLKGLGAKFFRRSPRARHIAFSASRLAAHRCSGCIPRRSIAPGRIRSIPAKFRINTPEASLATSARFHVLPASISLT